MGMQRAEHTQAHSTRRSSSELEVEELQLWAEAEVKEEEALWCLLCGLGLLLAIAVTVFVTIIAFAQWCKTMHA